jgi:essential nuclear protein 1
MPKATTPRSAAATRRHNPLAEDILTGGHLRTQPSKKNKRKSRAEEDHEDGERFIDAKMSRKILQIGQELADEDEAEQKAARGQTGEKVNTAFDFESRFEDEEFLSDDDERFKDDQWEDEEEVEEVVCFIPCCIYITPKVPNS